MSGLAALPMYDWPEVRAATDRLWAALRDALRARGVAAPERLARDLAPPRAWTDPRLVLGQACGLPLIRALAGRVELVGAPDYGVPGCPPGWYRSAVVVRADDPRDALADFRAARLALNRTDSQSGYGAILHHAAPLARDGRFFAAAEVTGAHAVSAARVAEGGADIAAIDFVSWRVFRRFRPDAARLRVLTLTDPTPGLPYVAAVGTDVAPHRAAAAAAIAGLDGAARDELGLEGFAVLTVADYEVIRERLDAAEARLRLWDQPLAGVSGL